jgi:hypothetical protein
MFAQILTASIPDKVRTPPEFQLVNDEVALVGMVTVPPM